VPSEEERPEVPLPPPQLSREITKPASIKTPKSIPKLNFFFIIIPPFLVDILSNFHLSTLPSRSSFLKRVRAAYHFLLKRRCSSVLSSFLKRGWGDYL
jgi:hypothetical protein